MGVTYTTAAERDVGRARRVRWRPGLLDAALAAASAFAILLILFTYQARFRALAFATGGAAAPPVNLNEAADAATLERALRPLFETTADRRVAAAELFGFLVQADGGRRVLPNVGAISRARIPAAAIVTNALSYRRRLAGEQARAAAAGQPAVESLPLLTGGELAAIKPSLIVRSPPAVRSAMLLWLALYIVAFHAVSMAWHARGIRGDRLLLTIAHVLTAIGFAAMISRVDPLRDTMLFVRYAQGVVVGLACAAVVSLVQLRRLALRDFSYLPLVGALLLSVVLIVFGGGPSGSSAKVNLGPIQPIEAIRLLLALFLAGYLARNWELLRAVRAESLGGVRLPRLVSLPRARYAVPVLVGVGAALAVFFFQKDLGPALILAIVFLAAYAIARGTVGMALGGTALLAAGFYVGYRLEISATLADRVRMWQSPWDNVARGGDQVAHALWAVATGGSLGTGPGLGDTRYLPAGHTDLILASIGEELGAAGVMAVATLYAALVWRALTTARRAGSDYGFFLSIVLMLFFAVPLALMAAGTLGLVPLTGVVTPFLSFGGSAMAANFIALALLAMVRSDEEAPADLEAFRVPLRWLTAGMALVGLVLAGAAVRVQALRADDYAVRPQLGVQADGTRRYQYNPRVLDIVRSIPRGTILDRQGLPLATDDDERLRKAAPAYERLGIVLRTACPADDGRCYPLGGKAFHLLGDVRSQVNWSARNTSYAERDSEARLRGFNSHPTSVRSTDADGGDVWTIRRDYHDLLPLLRHRYDPGHRDVTAFLSRPRQVRLTIDAGLQARVAAIVESYATRSAGGRAAAVVLDVATGDLLASVSYPWPATEALSRTAPGGDAADAYLDRARYGLYPPGSAFKLATAAAALGRGTAMSRTAFTCSRLPDGRVGAKVPGSPRPIRDDVLDRSPHGTIAMEQALIVSCNAYFAQLALRLGTGPLLDVGRRADIAVARGNDPDRLRATLPHAGYGQGEVVASPIRMARIAAAIAAGGAMRDVRLDAAEPAAPASEFLPPDSARLIGAAMRRVVLEGTGRGLRGHSVAIAGKTGTAEVGGAASHAWFVGFAPYGPAARRIALAVIVENAGYGGAAAAPAAGEIVSAAAAAGLLR
jgi:cell division protein FtsW (lipid II flippase)